MTVERLKELYDATPFKPFVLHLADGREIPVHHREFMLTVPSGRTIVVCQPDDRLNIIDVLMITDVELNGQQNGRRKRRRS